MRSHANATCPPLITPRRSLSALTDPAPHPLCDPAATVRKAMVQINELSTAGTPLALNQENTLT